MKLEYLIPYLPYKLRMYKSTWDKYPVLHYDYGGRGFISLNSALNEVIGAKPILHLLSEYCGKTTAGTVMKILNCSMKVVHQIWDLDSGTLSLNDITLETYNVMCKNHIDFHGLLKEGLAIDINTLKN